MRFESKQSVRRFYPDPGGNRAFHANLEAAFGGRLRLRWSLREGLWQIEQRIGPRFNRYDTRRRPVDEWFDELVRARDGYTRVMQIAPGTRFPCPECHLPLPAPLFKTEAVKCDHCASKGKDVRVPVAYYPLDGWALIDYLKTIDPERTTPSNIQRADARLAAKKRLDEEALARERFWGMRDALIDQLPKAGHPSLVPDAWRH